MNSKALLIYLPQLFIYEKREELNEVVFSSEGRQVVDATTGYRGNKKPPLHGDRRGGWPKQKQTFKRTASKEIIQNFLQCYGV